MHNVEPAKYVFKRKHFSPPSVFDELEFDLAYLHREQCRIDQAFKDNPVASGFLKDTIDNGFN
jgi:hypothetical protein